MRIIIETETAAAQPHVSYESEQESRRPDANDSSEPAGIEAIDGGPPAAELLASLGLADAITGEPSPGARAQARAGIDAGSAPSWLTAVIDGGASGRNS